MYAYNFTIDGQTFHYVGETSVKLNIIDKQGKETLQELNNKIKEKYEAVNSERVLYGGTVLDSNKNIINKPEVVQVQKRQKSDNAIRYKIIDGTFINIYSINDHTLLGTRNSWGINKSVDIYEDFSYGDAFNECLEHYGLTLEDMPHGTYAFSNPKIHLLAKELRIYSFTHDELNDRSISFDLANDETIEEYIEYYPETLTFYENISINRKHLVELLYHNRKKFRSKKDNNISLINCITHYQCFAKKSVRKYVNDNKVFNEYSLGCYRYIMSVVRQLSKIHSDSIKFYGIPLPKGMQIHKPTNLSPKYLSFWYEVLSNAYNNSLNKGLHTFKSV